MIWGVSNRCGEKESLIDNLPVRIHFIIVVLWWTGLAPWEFEFSFPGSLISAFLEASEAERRILFFSLSVGVLYR
jgi:hypothetical protein